METLIPLILKRIIWSEAAHKALFEYNLDATFMIDLDGRFIAVNPAAVRLSGYSPEEFYRMQFSTLAVPEENARVSEYFAESLSYPQRFDTVIKQKQGCPVDLDIMIVPIVVDDKTVGVYGIARDIRKRKLVEKQFHCLSHYDDMTGLFNRAYFEQAMQRLERERLGAVGLILCDVDGLKYFNDTLGRDIGDALLLVAAYVVKGATDPKDVVARIGGDEFAVLVNNGESQKVEAICLTICRAIADYNLQTPELPLSLSIGWAYRQEDAANLIELFKEAEDNMYREKLLHSRSTCGTFVSALMKALEARDYITEEHVDRLQEGVTLLGKALGLPDHQLADLRLLAKFHDIGKIGIPDRILLKPGPLTPQEFIEMQHHSQIGQQIAGSVPLFEPIADYILKHHEWWNGSGYPLGLKENEIPLECRILSISDAYDAMTNDRPYRKALSHEAAVAELKHGEGSQFDPNLVDLFIELIEKLEINNKIQ